MIHTLIQTKYAPNAHYLSFVLYEMKAIQTAYSIDVPICLMHFYYKWMMLPVFIALMAHWHIGTSDSSMASVAQLTRLRLVSVFDCFACAVNEQ